MLRNLFQRKTDNLQEEQEIQVDGTESGVAGI